MGGFARYSSRGQDQAVLEKIVMIVGLGAAVRQGEGGTPCMDYSNSKRTRSFVTSYVIE